MYIVQQEKEERIRREQEEQLLEFWEYHLCPDRFWPEQIFVLKRRFWLEENIGCIHVHGNLWVVHREIYWELRNGWWFPVHREFEILKEYRVWWHNTPSIRFSGAPKQKNLLLASVFFCHLLWPSWPYPNSKFGPENQWDWTRIHFLLVDNLGFISKVNSLLVSGSPCFGVKPGDARQRRVCLAQRGLVVCFLNRTKVLSLKRF